MKTSIPINISGRVYYIDTDAHQLLTEYMNNISFAFQGPEQAEIVSDIENRVHELLTERCSQREIMEAVTIEDVRDVISTIGRPEEMVEEEYIDIRINQEGPVGGNPNSGPRGVNNPGNHPGGNHGNNFGNGVNGGNGANNGDGGFPGNGGNGTTPPPFGQNGYANPYCNTQPQQNIHKKYFRDPEHAVFGGVIAGLGWYTGFSVPLMRFLLVVLSLIFGYIQWPILLYIIAWIIFPAAKTAKERLEMMGQPVTVSSIGDTLTSCPNPNAPSNVQNPTQPQQYSTLGQIAIVFAKVCLAIVALICIPVGIGAVIGAFTCLVLLIGLFFGLAAQITAQIPIGLPISSVGLGMLIGFLACVVISVICIGTIWAACCVLFNAKGLPRKTVITIAIITIVLAIGTTVLTVVSNIMNVFQPVYY